MNENGSGVVSEHPTRADNEQRLTMNEIVEGSWEKKKWMKGIIQE